MIHKAIDIHTHICPPDLKILQGLYSLKHTNCGADILKKDGSLFRSLKPNALDPKIRIKECEDFGVFTQVLSTIPVFFSYGLEALKTYDISCYFNDHLMAVCEEYPNRFYALVTLPMQDIKLAEKELIRCMKNPWVRGVQIGSNINQKNLGDAEFESFFKLCEELGASVFVHPWEMIGSDVMQKYWLPWLVGMPAETTRAIASLIFSGTLEKYKKLRIAFAHGGGSFPYTWPRLNHAFHCRPDLCAIDNKIEPKAYLNQIYVDSLVHDEKALEFTIKTMGEDFILLGSDYPFPLGEDRPSHLVKTSALLNESQKNKILNQNPKKWLGLINET